MSAPTLFEIDHVSGGYGSGLVVRDVSLSVTRGEAVCLLGRNGVGKSTLVKLACGFLKPRSGKCDWRARRSPGSSRPTTAPRA